MSISTLYDRVVETCSAPGTGTTVTLLGALSGAYQTWSSKCTNGLSYPYLILDQNGTHWETGNVTWNTGDTLTRAAAKVTDGSSGAGVLVNFSSGTQNVYLVDNAAWLNSIVTLLSTSSGGQTFSSSDYSGSLKQGSFQSIAQSPGGRLTLATGTPVTTTDQVAKSTLYYTPYLSNWIPYSTGGGQWAWAQFTETTLSLGGIAGVSGNNYDVFGYLSGSTFTLGTEAWTNNTTRANALQINGGRYTSGVYSSDLYLGTIYLTGISTTEDSVTTRGVWNMYNRVPRRLYKSDSTTSWTYTSAPWRALNGNSANSVALVIGLSEDVVNPIATFKGNSTTGITYSIGLNVDSTSATPTAPYISIIGGGGTAYYGQTAIISYCGYPGVGYHYIQMMESGASGATMLGSGSGGAIIIGECRA